MNDLHQQLIRIVREKTPEGVNPVDFLSEIIPIKKESLYRRLRGEMPFTLEEAAKIAVQLEISLDALLPYKSNETYKINMERIGIGNYLDSGYLTSLDRLLDKLRYLQSLPNSMYYCTTNTLPLTFLYKYSALSKFRVFVLNYQFREEITPPKFSEFTVHPAINMAEKSFLAEASRLPLTYVWTKGLFLPFISEVRFFQELGLLSKDDASVLKEESYAMLDEMENAVSRGEMETGAPFNVYLSDNFFDNNCLYLEAPSFRLCSVKVFGFSLYSTTEPGLCDNMKEWIVSLMKCSVLISKGGVIERFNFFRDQRDYLKGIDEF